MPVFSFRARGARGDLLEGRIEAASAEAVAAQLLNGGVTPIEINPSREANAVGTALSRLFGYRRPGLAELILLARQMYTLVRSGVPIVRGMRGVAESTRNPRMAEVLEDVAENLEAGQELAAALARHPDTFSNLFVSLVRVGENTGRLDEAFLRVGQYLEIDRDTRERVRAALRYPLMVIGAIGIAIAIINVMVIPAFRGVFERADVELPGPTLALIAVSDFFVAYWPLLVATVVAALAGARYWVGTEAGRYRWDKWKLKLPVVGDILHRATLGRFARAFALSSRSGVPLIQALTVVSRALDNEYVGDRIVQMRNGIERGDSLTRTAAATGLFTPLVLQMLAVGEESGAVDDLLEEVAGFYEREVDYDVRNLSTLVEPILIVAVGILVLVLALGVFLPMWDISTALK